MLGIFQVIGENFPIKNEESGTIELVMHVLEGGYLWRFERKELDFIYDKFRLERFDPKKYSNLSKLNLNETVLESIVLKRELKKHILEEYSKRDLKDIYNSLRNGAYRTMEKTEFRAICLSLLEKILKYENKYEDNYYYFFTLSAFLDEVFRRGLFDDRNSIIEKIICRIFSLVNEDEGSYWVGLIFKIIHSFENFSFYSLILPELLSVFDKLSSSYRANIFTFILNDTRHTTFISDHFSVVYELLEKVLGELSYFNRNFEDSDEYSMNDLIIGGAYSLADLIYALGDTPLLKLFVNPLKKRLSEIICEIESKSVINYVKTRLSWLNDDEVRLTLLSAVRKSTIKKKEVF